MLNNTKSLKEVIKDIIREQINSIKGIDIFQITGSNDDQTYSIKRLNTAQQFNSVESVGIGLGNGKGIIKRYNDNDLVLVTFIQNSETPIILGSVYDIYSTTKDTRVNIKKDELFSNNRINGSFIFIDENDNIIIKTPTGSKMKINMDGSFKILNKDGYGISVNDNGGMVFSGVTINHTQTPLTW